MRRPWLPILLAVVAADGSFTARRLPPGELTLRAQLRDDLAVTPARWDLVIDGIEIEPGETCDDPRLQDILVPGRLHRIIITVVDEVGAPIREFRLRRAWSTPGVRSEFGSSGGEGQATLRTRELPLDFEISAYGFCPQRIEGVTEDRTIVLKRGVPVRLVADGHSKGGSNPGWQLGVQLWKLDEAGRRLQPQIEIPGHGNYFSPEGDIRLRLPPGSYEIGFSLIVIQTGDRVRNIGFATRPRPRFTVLDGDAEQRVAVTIPEKKIRDLLRENSD